MQALSFSQRAVHQICQNHRCGTIHADEFEKFILQKIKEKLADFKEFELAGADANNPKIEELKARQIAIDNEINETVKNVAGASETVMAAFLLT